MFFVCLFVFHLFSFSSVIPHLIERTEVLHCCSERSPRQLSAKLNGFFFFSNWVEAHSIANNNLRSSWLSLGPVGEYRMTWPSLWDRSPLALGLGVLGFSIYTVLLKSIPEWGWNYVRDTPNQWRSGSWDPRFPQWWRTPLPAMLETSEARMR